MSGSYRNRERSDVTELTLNATFISGYNGSSTALSYGRHNGFYPMTCTYWQSISDVTGRHGKVNPVHQFKFRVRHHSAAHTFTQTSGPYVSTVIPHNWPVILNWDARAKSVEETVSLTMPVPSPDDVNGFAMDAFNAFYEQIPTEVSIPNFLWELREIKALIPRLQSSLTKTASGGYLNFQFGWKPFLDDLRKLWALTDTVRSRLEYLKSTYGRKTRIGLFQDITSQIEGRYQGYSDWHWSADPPRKDVDFQGNFKVREFRTVLRAGGYLYHELQGLDDSLTQVKAFSSALGLNNPLRAVWNALPYSFVVEWFTNIGGLFDRLSIQPFSGEWTISNPTWSFKSTAVIDAYQRFGDKTDANTHLLATITAERYQRFVGLPVPASIFSLELTSKQQLLLLALLNQRT